MSQIIIKDINFCENDLPETNTIKGSASFFDFDFDWDSDAVFDNAGAAAVGVTFGFGIAIGNKIALVIAQSFALGIKS